MPGTTTRTGATCDGIAVIRDEHRKLASVLSLLMSQVSACIDTGQEPDLKLFSLAFDYVDGFLNTQHHPKENLYLFTELRRQRPDTAGVIEKLEGEHRDGAVVLARARAAISDFRKTGDAAALYAAIGRYCQFEFDHMRLEEDHILPAAEESLSPSARSLMNRAFVENHLDPLFGNERRAQFDRLFHAIKARTQKTAPASTDPVPRGASRA